MQLERHGWDIHAVSAEPDRAGARSGLAGGAGAGRGGPGRGGAGRGGIWAGGMGSGVQEAR